MCECGTLKTVKVILRRRKRKKENNGGYTICLYRNVTIRPTVQILCNKKNIFLITKEISNLNV
jgi:hypothetical protein